MRPELRSLQIPVLCENLQATPNVNEKRERIWLSRTEPSAWTTESNNVSSTAGEVEGTRKRARLRGVDVARAVAVLGMVAVHFGPNPLPETFGGDLYGVFRGRASVLFVLLAGVGVALLARRGTGWRVRGRLLTRGALLLPLGMWLQGLDHNVLVILQYYAVYFLFAALLLSAPGWLIFIGIGFSLTLGPMLYLVGFDATPRLFAEGYAAFGEPVGAVFYDLLLSGAYPLATWAAPLLFGILLGRLDLTSSRIRIGMVLGGLAMAVGSALGSGSIMGDEKDCSGAERAASKPRASDPTWRTIDSCVRNEKASALKCCSTSRHAPSLRSPYPPLHVALRG